MLSGVKQQHVRFVRRPHGPHLPHNSGHLVFRVTEACEPPLGAQCDGLVAAAAAAKYEYGMAAFEFHCQGGQEVQQRASAIAGGHRNARHEEKCIAQCVPSFQSHNGLYLQLKWGAFRWHWILQTLGLVYVEYWQSF